MAFCPVCGENVSNNSQSCPKCGAPLGDRKNNQSSNTQQAVNDFVNSLNNTADYSSQMDANDVEQNKVMGVLAYIGILVFIPIFAAPDSKFARFHANQGLTLFIFEVVYSLIMTVLGVTIGKVPVAGPIIIAFCGLVGLVWLILSICGIVNAVNGRAKELPVLGNIHIKR